MQIQDRVLRLENKLPQAPDPLTGEYSQFSKKGNHYRTSGMTDEFEGTISKATWQWKTWSESLVPEWKKGQDAESDLELPIHAIQSYVNRGIFLDTRSCT